MFIALLIIAIILILVFIKYWWIILLIILGIYLASLILPHIGDLLFMLVDNVFDSIEGLFIHGHRSSIPNIEAFDVKEESVSIDDAEEEQITIVTNTNCPNCAARILPGAKQCDYCGTRFIR